MQSVEHCTVKGYLSTEQCGPLSGERFHSPKRHYLIYVISEKMRLPSSDLGKDLT